jgi:hypothetical protein
VIRTNLATRPFYNERAVRLLLLLVATLGVAATMFNINQVVQLSRRDTAMLTQAYRDEARAADLRRDATRLRATVDPRLLEAASADARQANDLIDRRTFSWTELLNLFETTLPDQVRIATLRPKVEAKRGIVMTIIVFGRDVEDINQFVDNIEATHAFSQLQKLDERFDEQGDLQATIEGVYTPSAAGRQEKPAEGADR